jgi:hypothetical protein
LTVKLGVLSSWSGRGHLPTLSLPAFRNPPGPHRRSARSTVWTFSFASSMTRERETPRRSMDWRACASVGALMRPPRPCGSLMRWCSPLDPEPRQGGPPDLPGTRRSTPRAQSHATHESRAAAVPKHQAGVCRIPVTRGFLPPSHVLLGYVPSLVLGPCAFLTATTEGCCCAA